MNNLTQTINSENIVENIRKRIDRLPDKIQKILVSDELADYFLELDRQNHLTMEQFDVMVETTHQVFLGMINPSIFLPLLSGQLIDKGLHPVIAKEVTQKIESKFIAPFREDLEKIYRRFSTMEKLEKEIQEEVKKEEVSKSLEAEEKEVEKLVTQEETKEIQETPPQLLIIGEEKSSAEIPQKQIESQAMSISSKPEEIVSQIQSEEEKPKRSFLSFLKFKTSGKEQEAAETSKTVIIGKEEEFKPVLEEISPWRISFEDVKPAKEKVVSEIELKHEEEIKPIGVREQPIFKKDETTQTVQKEEPSSMPAEPIVPIQTTTPPLDLEKKTQPSISVTETTESSIEKRIPLDVKLPSESSQEKKVSESTTVSEFSKEQPTRIEESDSQNIPAENVIDLRKLKF